MDIKKLRILYFGTPEISAFVLEKLILDAYNIVGIVSQEDKPQGRKNLLLPTPTKLIGNKYNIPVFQPHKIRLDYEFIKELNVDIILTLAYGQIIPHEVLTFPKFGSFNLHGSLLPLYRGAAPIQYALLNGDKVSGVTLMEMVDKMDAGKMYYKVEVNILDSDNYDSLKNKIALAAYQCFIEGIEDVVSKKNSGVEQDEAKVSFTKKIEEKDQKLNFDETSFSIHNRIRALSFNPGSYFIYKNIKFKVYLSKIMDSKGQCGEILEYSKNGLLIGTKDSSLMILEIQKPGKNRMTIKEFFNGNKDLFIKGDIIN